MQSASSGIIATKTTPSRFHTLTMITLLLLAIQFLVGTVVNLFVQIPSSHPGAHPPEYFSGVVQGDFWALTQSGLIPLVAHVILGILLLLASLILLGLSISSRQRGWILASVFGLIGIIGAGFNGASFLNYGEDFSSLLMSVGFFLSMISYVIGLYIPAKAR